MGSVRSELLGMDTNLNVVLPYDRPAENQQSPCKTLYLLHGLGENAAAWLRYTKVESYAREHGVALVMPEVQRGFYCDMQYGLKYFSYIAEELPELCAKLFRIGTGRENSYIAGLSMGGYGALKTAFAFPDKFAGCAGFSGVLDLGYVLREHLDDQNESEYHGLFGPELAVKPQDDLYLLAERLAERENPPKILITCGKQDFLYQVNADFKSHLESTGLPFVYREWDGVHEWGFWDESIKMSFDFFFNQEYNSIH